MPLIVFEYNHVTKKHFELTEMASALGPKYLIYRLKNDGTLDQNFSKTWNLVAVPQNSKFFKIENFNG